MAAARAPRTATVLLLRTKERPALTDLEEEVLSELLLTVEMSDGNLPSTKEAGQSESKSIHLKIPMSAQISLPPHLSETSFENVDLSDEETF